MTRSRIVACILTLYCSLYAQQAFASQAVQKFDADAASLDQNIKTTIHTATDLHGKILELQNLLNLPSKVDSDLRKLTKTMTTVKELLEAAALVPEIRTEAQEAAAAIGDIEKPIQDAERSIADFDAKLEPVKKKLKAFDQKLQTLIQKMHAFQTRFEAYVTKIDQTQDCMNNLPGGSVRDGLQKNLDRIATASDTAVVALNSRLAAVISEEEKLATFFHDKLDPAVDPIKTIESDIDTLESRLDGILAPVRELGSLLNQRISVSFPYPCGVKAISLIPPKVETKWCDFGLKFTLEEILKGPEWLENEIEKLLSSVLWDAAEAFGIDKLIKSLEDEANGVITGVTKTLQKLLASVDINIPGLARIEADLDAIDNDIKTLESELDVAPIEQEIREIEKTAAEVDAIYQSCEKVTG